MIRFIKCWWFGHEYDWPEYDKRLEKEEHYAAGLMVYCSRCKTYKRYKED